MTLTDADLAAARLWASRADHERELVSAVLASPAQGFDDARSLGVTAHQFSDDLARTCWLAVAAKRHRRSLTGDAASDRLGVLALVRTHLVRDGTWDNDRHPVELADLATSHFAYDPAFVAVAADRLLATVARFDRLFELYTEAAALLEAA